ncbi:MAG: type II toxin-antitoxin system RelE/ParE family toxin [Flavobacteriales bacterium]|nr:type II toxin-antitoxin system RelE/ParE family toxin [Flavobacteriales bacterium]MBK6946613.1 type II toxin-antitoxin system RelE/ParE family toxin [Flavobacteriales bacterium]MBK7239649.1 type II toxin-antitoxin system RelE/ParE family toxin [Flavobacteriales bacterium]MBK7298667.1 type II toxin-antitoxin system RelE/ParE family toxin [Flavobacteriales bacterium]MBK9536664.1 type II toxin-antitoxin system RelE/ParE family toxin [Flavobacteriales bacterium]
MTSTLVWRGAAIRDLQLIYDQYEALSSGTGERFLSELDEYVTFVVDHPSANPKWRSHYRKITLVHFPYLVIYGYQKGTVTIFSIFHGKRNPAKWGKPK